MEILWSHEIILGHNGLAIIKNDQDQLGWLGLLDATNASENPVFLLLLLTYLDRADQGNDHLINQKQDKLAQGYTELSLSDPQSWPTHSWVLEKDNNRVELATSQNHFGILVILFSNSLGAEPTHEFDNLEEAVAILKIVMQGQLQKLIMLGY